MLHDHAQAPHHQYVVTVGHAKITVSSCCQHEAIRLARRELSREMPRLWDVIHRLEEHRFRVDPAH